MLGGLQQFLTHQGQPVAPWWCTQLGDYTSRKLDNLPELRFVLTKLCCLDQGLDSLWQGYRLSWLMRDLVSSKVSGCNLYIVTPCDGILLPVINYSLVTPQSVIINARILDWLIWRKTCRQSHARSHCNVLSCVWYWKLTKKPFKTSFNSF